MKQFQLVFQSPVQRRPMLKSETLQFENVQIQVQQTTLFGNVDIWLMCYAKY